jgi:apolipoprotein N-acyltransferase
VSQPERAAALKSPYPRPASARPIALAAVGGTFHFLGFAGFGIWPLALICLVPLWMALERSRGRLRAAALLGLVFGWVSYAGGYWWLWRIVDVFLHGDLLLGAVIWLADSLWFALRYALYAVLYALVRRRGWPVAVAALPALIVVEWLYPLLFPVHLGHALAERTTVIQMAALGGPLLLTAFAALLNVAVFDTWRWRRGERARPLGIWGAAGLAVVLATGYGTVRMARLARDIATAPTLRVGIVQGNLGVQEKGAQAERDHRRYLEQTRALLAGGAVDLVVWPETVYMRGVRGPLPISGELIRADLRVPLLLGAALVRTDSGRRLTYNSALLIAADGVIREAYDKNLLIPFTEYVPLASALPFLGERVATASHFAAAADVPALSLGPARIATPICYEAVRPAFVRRMVREGKANLLVTLANDAWFGDSQGPWLHLVMARQRAVEHRRYLVRATNSGVSAVIDPMGREVARSGLLTRENLRATVALLDDLTTYARWGDWPAWISLLILSAALTIRPPGLLRCQAVGCSGTGTFSPTTQQRNSQQPFGPSGPRTLPQA